jgi:hypothetical protein
MKHGTVGDDAMRAAVIATARAIVHTHAPQIGEPVLLPDAEMDVVLEKFRTYGQSPT